MISFFSSATICPRAAFILSARAMSSAESSFTMSCVTVFTSVSMWLTAYGLRLTAYGLWLMAYGLWLMAYGLRLTSVSKSVDDVVHAQLEGLVRILDGPVAAVGELPEFREVRVVVRNRNQPLLRVVVLEQAAEDRR